MDKEEVSKAKLIEYAKKIIEAEKKKIPVDIAKAVLDALKKDLGVETKVSVTKNGDIIYIQLEGRQIDATTMAVLDEVLDGYRIHGIQSNTGPQILFVQYKAKELDC